MKCPVCKDVTLLMSEKNGVDDDYRRDDRYRREETYRKDYKKKKSPMSALGDIMEIFGGE